MLAIAGVGVAGRREIWPVGWTVTGVIWWVGIGSGDRHQRGIGLGEVCGGRWGGGGVPC